jgi:pectate lyase
VEGSGKGRPDAHGDEQDEQRHDEGDDEFGSHVCWYEAMGQRPEVMRFGILCVL